MPRQKYIDGVGQVDYTPEEEAEADILEQEHNNNIFQNKLQILREDRNKLLADSDWEVIMAKEKGTNLSSAFKTWRQDLRDITEGLNTAEEVEAVEFPEKP